MPEESAVLVAGTPRVRAGLALEPLDSLEGIERTEVLLFDRAEVPTDEFFGPNSFVKRQRAPDCL